MSSDTQRPLFNGGIGPARSRMLESEIDKLNELLDKATYLAEFHGDALIGDKSRPDGIVANLQNLFADVRKLSFGNIPEFTTLFTRLLLGKGVDMQAGAEIVASLSNDSNLRAGLIQDSVAGKYERMLHPPLSYLGDAFKYRTADGKFNSAIHPHLGQAGAPYAKTVPSKTHPLGALPDAGDLFDRLMAREDDGRESKSGLSSMLIYHATIIIHDIFRTNEKDKNISDTSSYLDLSPLYGFTDEMQRKVRDDKYKLGLLKPDTFAEDRLLRQPPGVCIMLVMYNRYHNYCASQLRRINENGKFSVPRKYSLPKLAAAAKNFVKDDSDSFKELLNTYASAWKEWKSGGEKPDDKYDQLARSLQERLDQAQPDKATVEGFNVAWEAAWDKLDNDLFNTARLITCGMYIQVSIHDYLRALMGFHQFDSNFTLDPRVTMPKEKNVSQGIGNQVTVEFNLLYRFHCALSLKDERYAEDFIRESMGKVNDPSWDPKEFSMQEFMGMMAYAGRASAGKKKTEPWDQEFGLTQQPDLCFKRNPITGLFDDEQMVKQLTVAMDDPISNFGPRNVPRCLKPVEILGITQARKWEIGTLNDFRGFFGMERHKTFESITPHPEVAAALRDLYEHPDKVELYPGVFCESDKKMGADPGPSDVDSALWAAIFSDAITLVRSDRFYTTDWNTNSLTTWGMKEVTPDNDVLKTSVFHRLLQRAFPEWYPYESIRFFSPFYTSKQNAQYAHQQGYAEGFKMEVQPKKTNWAGRPTEYEYLTAKSDPTRPVKPLYLTESWKIKALLSDTSDNVVHPARLTLKYLPKEIQDVLQPGQTAAVPQDGEDVDGDPQVMMKYFTDLMRDIVTREFVTMDKKKRIYQLDVVKDFAIPVVTRYVADFLGFGNLVRSDKNRNAKYSENEIYQHITNCQVFLSYNVDETKLLKRRQAFTASMKFLFKLTQSGNIQEANRWAISRWTKNSLEYLLSFGKERNPMRELGFRVAQDILKHEKDAGKAAAILLLVGLDSAYNSVLAFTSVLDLFIHELYDVAQPKLAKKGKKVPASVSCDWFTLQRLAFDDNQDSTDGISDLVLKAQRESVRLPIIRRAVQEHTIENEAGEAIFTVKEGQTVICDLHAAAQNEANTATDETDYLAYRSSFTEKFASYHPKHTAAMGLTAMVKVLAQMKNLRRGHDAQGKVKRVNIDASYEGYSNYMAPMRMKQIEIDVKHALEDAHAKGDAKAEADLKKLFNTKVMKPTTHTYLTPEWDEMIPFPTTWKLRFDGFGTSDYGGTGYPMLLQQNFLPDDMPPWYQPKGISHTGGSFATPIADTQNEEAKNACPVTHSAAQGCALPGRA
ncbi:hypothetical protein G7046_g4030 [Stylonectria norvegica]|nr:hypothetical protein G7046_g4030 [Stylonectria norvegica]